MTVNRVKNFPFSIDSLVISDYATGKPVVAKQLTGQSATLNVGIKTASLEGGEYHGPMAVEAFGGEISMDATMQEVPKRILNYCNQGTLATTATCASATVGSVTNKKGTSLSTVVTAVVVSAGQHALVKTDTLYFEALTTSTFTVTNYSKGKDTATLTVSGAGGQYDTTVMPGLSITLESASSFTVGDTAVVEVHSLHGGMETYSYGIEKTCGSSQYVAIQGVACNASDGDRYRFEMHKALMTGVGMPMTHGDFMTLTVHADAMVDDTLSTPKAGYIEQMKGA